MLNLSEKKKRKKKGARRPLEDLDISRQHRVYICDSGSAFPAKRYISRA
jgi:hypothetical protein